MVEAGVVEVPCMVVSLSSREPAWPPATLSVHAADTRHQPYLVHTTFTTQCELSDTVLTLPMYSLCELTVGWSFSTNSALGLTHFWHPKLAGALLIEMSLR